MIGAIFVFAVGMVCGFAVFAIYASSVASRMDGLPCPHALCKNVLPRQGAWSHADDGWAVEECPVCLGKVQFLPLVGMRVPDSGDRYIRVHTKVTS